MSWRAGRGRINTDEFEKGRGRVDTNSKWM